MEPAKPQDGGFASAGLDYTNHDNDIFYSDEGTALCRKDAENSGAGSNDPNATITSYHFSFKGRVLPPSLKGLENLNGRILRWIDESTNKFFDVVLSGEIIQSAMKVNNLSGSLSLIVTTPLPLKFKLHLLGEGESGKGSEEVWKDCNASLCSPENPTVVEAHFEKFQWKGMENLSPCGTSSQNPPITVEGVFAPTQDFPTIWNLPKKPAPELNLPDP